MKDYEKIYEAPDQIMLRSSLLQELSDVLDRRCPDGSDVSSMASFMTVITQATAFYALRFGMPRGRFLEGMAKAYDCVAETCSHEVH
ncbi:MAG: hypothetical protein RL563_2665 [Pseudomonadota bacterium]|jgi:hypothetical protein